MSRGACLFNSQLSLSALSYFNSITFHAKHPLADDVSGVILAYCKDDITCSSTHAYQKGQKFPSCNSEQTLISPERSPTLICLNVTERCSWIRTSPLGLKVGNILGPMHCKATYIQRVYVYRDEEIRSHCRPKHYEYLGRLSYVFAYKVHAASDQQGIDGHISPCPAGLSVAGISQKVSPACKPTSPAHASAESTVSSFTRSSAAQSAAESCKSSHSD